MDWFFLALSLLICFILVVGAIVSFLAGAWFIAILLLLPIGFAWAASS